MKKLFAGWDGGGTATGTVCVDESGKIIAQGHFGPLNLNGSNAEAVSRTVADCVRWMNGAGECQRLCIGAAGVSNDEASALLRERLQAEGYGGSLLLAGDHEIALAGAVGESGAVLIAGTGSICYGKNANGKCARGGGFGHLLDDEGSGYAIGRDILSAVLRSWDGREGPTALAGAVADFIGADGAEALVGYAYGQSRGKADIARLAPLLAPTVALGDEAAARIVEKAANELCGLAEAVLTRLCMPDAEIALLGSVLMHCEPVARRVMELLARRLPESKVIHPRASAAYGAAMLALAGRLR